MRLIVFISILLFTFPFSDAIAQSDLRLWYNQPARNWNEALPVGNGRLGAMIFGRADEELIQLNEETLWSGGPVNNNPSPLARKVLPQIREALFREDYESAEKLTQQMQGLFTESYEPLGDIIIKHHFDSPSEPKNYYRDLNISNATSTTRFTKDGIIYTLEIFVSAPDQIILIHLTASQKNALNFSASVSSPLVYNNTIEGSEEIVMKGKAPSHTDPSYLQTMEVPVIYNDPSNCDGMRFQLRVKAKTTDGKITSDDRGLHITGATEATLFLSAATSFNGVDKCPDKDGKDENLIASPFLNKAFSKSIDLLRKEHIADYQKYFNRVSLSLDSSPPQLPTDERLKRYAEGGKDTALEVLYFQYGRYLLISSSRPGGIPANLQGIWNNHVRPPWSSNFTTNINTEMNYWMEKSAGIYRIENIELQ